MTAQVETALRGPEAYALARRVVDAMQEASGFWDDPEKSQKNVVKTR